MSGPRFQIPDLSSDRPKVPEVRALVEAYYDKPGNATGGNCHIVLDDGNLKTQHIVWALERCEAAGDKDGAEIMRLMLRMTPSQRRRVRK